MAPVDQECAQLLHGLARDHPRAHPSHLALLLQVRHGIEITGQKALQLMKAYPAAQPHERDH